MTISHAAESPVGMVERVVLILDVFERSGSRLRLGQIASRTGLPRSSVHRILQQLVDARYLYRDGTDYMLGLRVFELGGLVVSRSRLSRVAAPFLHDLSRSTGHIVHLAILDGHDVVYLEKIGGEFGSRLPSRVGGRFPAHCSAVGKALLAFSAVSLPDGDLRMRTTASIKSQDQLLLSLAGIREAGYATDVEESVPGVACIGVPIIEGGSASAALSVCAPRDRMDLGELRHRVMWTGAEISRRLAAGPRSMPVSRLAPTG